MNTSPVFSIIIPVYNGEKNIRKTIDSVLAQTYRNYELLIVDDGSTDNTSVVLKEYEDNPVIKIFRKENGGVSSARNYALQKSSGRYICFADGDDLLDSEYLNVFQELMKDYDLGICGFAIIEENEYPVPQYSGNQTELSNIEIIQRALRFRDIACSCWNKCFKKEIIDRNHLTFDESLSIGEDMLFLISYCLHITKGILTDSVLYYYINRQDSVIRDVQKTEFNEKWYSEWEAVKKTETLLNQNNIRINEIHIKKVRISNKLLNMMRRYKAKNPQFRKEMRTTVKQNYKVYREKEFTCRQKASILLKKLF